MEIDYSANKDLRNLIGGMVAELHPELLRRATRSGLYKLGNQLRRRAILAFEARVPGLAGRVNKAINLKVHRNLEGFRVRVLHARPEAMTTNRRGLEKPLAHFFEHGGKMDGSDRYTLGRRGRKAHNTGNIEGVKAIEEVDRNTPSSEIDSQLLPLIENFAQKIFKKYGS